ncbi:MAG: hypothetical protein P3A28_05615 [Gemmatimonadota bacterium]|nr:hypothetical protein [Gemmatimonadota bacterium]
MTPNLGNPGQIAGTLLPLVKAEELLGTLESVVSAKIVTDTHGGVDTIHLLVSGELKPKQVVRNVESALAAHFGMRVDHRKVSVATTIKRPKPPLADVAAEAAAAEEKAIARAARVGRSLYFEDVEIRGSRSKGMTCRVTLRRGDQQFVGEAEGPEGDRGRVELAARASLGAVALSETGGKQFSLEGVKVVAAFDREVVLVAVTVRMGRQSAVLTGSCWLRDSAETAGVLAVLDATNRWIEGGAEAAP